LRARRRAASALGHEQAQHVGHVLLPLVVVGAEARQAAAQGGGVADVDAGIDLADGPLGVGGVPLLDDRAHRAVVVPHDAPETGGVVDLRGEDGEHVAGCPVGLDEGGHRRGAEQGRVPVDQQHRPVEIRDGGERDRCGVPGPVLLVLDDGQRRGGDPRQVLLHRLPARADHHDGGGGVQRLGGGEHVAEETAPAEGVQDLGRRRTHAGALPCGQDDDGGQRGPPGGGGHR
jgi:hypothetical protein